MDLLIRLVRKGIEGSTKQHRISTNVSKQVAQELVNRDYSMFIEGGGVVEIIGQILPIESE
jgi:hypothetical protein